MNQNKNHTYLTLEYLMGAASRELNNALNRAFQNEGIHLTAEQWNMLMSLWKTDGQCPHELAKCQTKDRASITRLITNLEKNNLVVRITSEKDRRHKLIYLTSKGKKLENSTMDLAEKIIADAMTNISCEEMKVCINVLERIKSNLEKNYKP